MKIYLTALSIALVSIGCKTTDTSTSETLNRPDPGPAAPLYPTADTGIGEELWDNEAAYGRQIMDEIENTIRTQYQPGQARRDAHPKAHGCVKAKFKVRDNLRPDLAKGAFVPGKTYDAWIRFSNGSGDPTKADIEGDGRGMAIKLLGVPGDKLLEVEREAMTQDFIMINHPVFFIDDPADYIKMIRAIGSSNPLGRIRALTVAGWRGARIALKISKKKIPSPLQARYWSMVPYQLGTGADRNAIKFSAKPCSVHQDELPSDPSPNYLRERMRNHLASNSGCFEFLVQARTSPDMDVENSRIEWQESDAPFHKVAHITIPPQNFDTPEQNKFCENLSYNPWHALPAHKPLGAVNRIRKVVYEKISRVRHQMNSVPRQEP